MNNKCICGHVESIHPTWEHTRCYHCECLKFTNASTTFCACGHPQDIHKVTGPHGNRKCMSLLCECLMYKTKPQVKILSQQKLARASDSSYNDLTYQPPCICGHSNNEHYRFKGECTRVGCECRYYLQHIKVSENSPSVYPICECGHKIEGHFKLQYICFELKCKCRAYQAQAPQRDFPKAKYANIKQLCCEMPDLEMVQKYSWMACAGKEWCRNCGCLWIDGKCHFPLKVRKSLRTA